MKLSTQDLLLCGRAIVGMYPSDSVFSKSMVEYLRKLPAEILGEMGALPDGAEEGTVLDLDFDPGCR